MPSPKPSFGVEQFLDALLSQLVIEHRRQIAIGDASVEEAFTEALDRLRAVADDAPRDEEESLLFRSEVYDILYSVGPDPYTGHYDRLWSALRERQPGAASMLNPELQSLSIGLSTFDAHKAVGRVPARWRSPLQDVTNTLSAVV